MGKGTQETSEGYRQNGRGRMAGDDADSGVAPGSNGMMRTGAPMLRMQDGEGIVRSNGIRRMGPLSAIEAQVDGEDVPIWLAALIASSCRASVNGEGHDVRWSCVSGRAFYTNASTEVELIQPLGVCLERGHTLAVTWAPGETEYTVEVYGGLEHCA